MNIHAAFPPTHQRHAAKVDILKPSIADVIAGRGIRLRKQGASEFVGPCPVCAAGHDRFSVNLAKQVFFCRGSGRGGDVIDLVRYLDGCDFATALRTLAGGDWKAAPIETAALAAKTAADSKARMESALAIWREAVAVPETLAEVYLRKRGITFLPGDHVLRFHPACPFGTGHSISCMIALYRDIVTNEPRAIHRTAIKTGGLKAFDAKNSRKALAPIGGCAIKLTEDAHVDQGLMIGEGLETVLSAMQLGFKPAWAVGDDGGIAKFPVLAGIDALTIFVDNDAADKNGRLAGPSAASECSKRWVAAGREVRRIIPRGVNDMNDLISKGVRHHG